MSSASCGECGAALQLGANFCAQCGRAVEGERGHRRHLTLLFSDLVGWTSLSETLDPEDLDNLATEYRRVCRDAIRAYRGHLSQFLGDGVLSYFGYPRANEDDAMLATRAALRIVSDVRALNDDVGRRLRAELHVRVGLNSGPTIFGDAGGRERFAIGEPVNLAARIQSIAEPDTVLVSGATARLIEGYFDLRPLGATRVRGLDRPIELYEVIRPTGARTRFEAAARGRLTPHVGRAAELAQIAGIWRQVVAGQPQVVVVQGEPGIGKSRLLHEARRTAIGLGAVRLSCFCSPLTQATAFAPIVELLEDQLRHWAPVDSESAPLLGALAALVADEPRFGPDALPLLAALLGIDGADQQAIADVSPVRRRARTLEILRDWLSWTAERYPVAVLVEDLHWADPSTLEFLTFLVSDPPPGPVLLFMTARTEFAIPWAAAQFTCIELGRLPDADVAVMVGHVAGGRTMPPVLVSKIASRTEGVPLFVEEVTKEVLASGVVRIEQDHCEMVGEMSERYLPPTVHGSLTARFDRLDESRHVAQLGAAIGREFTYDLIRAVAGLPEDELRDKLEVLSQSELVFAHGAPPLATYIFKHALIRDAIYDNLLKPARLSIHGKIFTALQEQFPELLAARPEMGAYHAENAGRPDAAVPLLKMAGLRALDRKALAEAVGHLEKGEKMLHVLPEPEQTAMEVELQAALGPAYMATVGWAAPQVERSSARLRDLAARRGDGPRLFQAMWSLWTVDFLRGNLGPALEIAKQVLDMANVVGDPMLRTAGHHAVGYTHFYRGEYEPALSHADQGLALYDLERELVLASIFQFSSSAAMRCFRTEALQVLGRPAEAADSLRAWRELLDDLRHPPSRAYSLTQQCFYFHVQGDQRAVREAATGSRALSMAEGFSLWVPITETFLAWADAQEGRNPGEAVERIRAAKQRIDASLTRITEVELTAMHAETLLLANRPEQVAEVVSPVLELSAQLQLRHYVPELYRLEGEAARRLGDWDGAVTLYRKAVEAARGMNAQGLEQRAAAALAQIRDESPAGRK